MQHLIRLTLSLLFLAWILNITYTDYVVKRDQSLKVILRAILGIYLAIASIIYPYYMKHHVFWKTSSMVCLIAIIILHRV